MLIIRATVVREVKVALARLCRASLGKHASSPPSLPRASDLLSVSQAKAPRQPHQLCIHTSFASSFITTTISPAHPHSWLSHFTISSPAQQPYAPRKHRSLIMRLTLLATVLLAAAARTMAAPAKKPDTDAKPKPGEKPKRYTVSLRE